MDSDNLNASPEQTPKAVGPWLRVVVAFATLASLLAVALSTWVAIASLGRQQSGHYDILSTSRQLFLRRESPALLELEAYPDGNRFMLTAHGPTSFLGSVYITEQGGRGVVTLEVKHGERFETASVTVDELFRLMQHVEQQRKPAGGSSNPREETSDANAVPNGAP